MRIRCTTTFDITATGVTGHYKPSRVPFVDRAGTTITSEGEWNRSRNQQRNWETITQLISLRTQVDDLSTPTADDGVWAFEFTTESDTVFLVNLDPVAVLKQDCIGVPMLIGLNEQSTKDSVLTSSNIWFDPINIL